ncbi:MAG: SOS response-associated peptidase [Hyphomicrobiaceae bacterium]
MATCYSLTSPPDVVQQRFGYHNSHDYPPREAIWPKQPVMIVRNDHAMRREAALVRWGLIPAWVRDFDRLATLSSARVETVADKPSFRGAIRHKRCLVPANGFRVWSEASGVKVPYLLQAADRSVLGFAALYEQWMGADGSEIDSMALITVPAYGAAAAYCARMPAILAEEDFTAWLDCRNVRADEALALLGGPEKKKTQVTAQAEA